MADTYCVITTDSKGREVYMHCSALGRRVVADKLTPAFIMTKAQAEENVRWEGRGSRIQEVQS